MTCDECKKKEKRIAELEGLVKRMAESVDRINRRARMAARRIKLVSHNNG